MIAFASVDLPEPFGLISAWNSPARTCRSTPLRICLSAAVTCRFLIWSSPIGSLVSRHSDRGSATDAGARVELDQLRQRRLLQRADNAQLHPRPQQLGRAGAGVRAV